MRKLLSAGIVRLMRCKPLWLSCLIVAGFETVAIMENYLGGVEFGLFPDIDSVYFLFVLIIVFLVPVTVAFFIGPEYGDGAIRNKLVTGSTRRDVYSANLILSSLSAVMLCAFGVVPGLALGLPLLGSFEAGAAAAAMKIFAVFVMAIAIAAISTTVMMLVDNRTVSSIAIILLAILMFAVGFYINMRLDAPPTIVKSTTFVNGVLSSVEEAPNPAYIEPGLLRDALDFLDTALPGGQAMNFIMDTAEVPWLMASYSAAICALMTVFGFSQFKKKDLR